MASYLDSYRFAEAYDLLYHFVWDDVADWYIEASKAQTGREVLGYVLENILKLAHPFAPFVTETIWQTLYADTDSLLITSAWPKPMSGDKGKVKDFEQIQTIVMETRSIIRSLALVKPNLYYNEAPFLADNAELLIRLSGVGSIKEVTSGGGLRLTSTPFDCWLDVDSNTIKSHAAQLEGQIADQEKLIAGLQARLDNKSYVKNAPKAIVNQTKDQIAEAKAALERLHAEQERFTAHE
jgi:valyl-tRNA synthetase